MKRVLTAAVLLPIVIYAVLWANFWIFLAVLVTVAFLCYHEYSGIAASYGFGTPGVLGYGVGVLPRPTSRYSRANPLEKHLMRRKLGFSVMMGLIGVTLLLFAHHLESLVR